MYTKKDAYEILCKYKDELIEYRNLKDEFVNLRKDYKEVLEVTKKRMKATKPPQRAFSLMLGVLSIFGVFYLPFFIITAVSFVLSSLCDMSSFFKYRKTMNNYEKEIFLYSLTLSHIEETILDINKVIDDDIKQIDKFQDIVHSDKTIGPNEEKLIKDSKYMFEEVEKSGANNVVNTFLEENREL